MTTLLDNELIPIVDNSTGEKGFSQPELNTFIKELGYADVLPFQPTFLNNLQSSALELIPEAIPNVFQTIAKIGVTLPGTIIWDDLFYLPDNALISLNVKYSFTDSAGTPGVSNTVQHTNLDGQNLIFRVLQTFKGLQNTHIMFNTILVPFINREFSINYTENDNVLTNSLELTINSFMPLFVTK